MLSNLKPTYVKTGETLLWLGAAGIVLLLSVRTLAEAPVFCDSGYHLSIMQRMQEGCRLYTDIGFGYTPLFPHLLLWIERLTGIGSHYEIWLALHLCLLAGVAGWIFLLTQNATGSRRWGAFAAWLFYLSAFAVQGDAILPEAPSLFCGMAALWLTVRPQSTPWRFLLAGMLCLCAFGFKQYGLGFTPLCLWMLLTRRENAVSGALWFLAGGAAAFALLYGWEPGFISVTGSSYGSNDIARIRYAKLGPLRYMPGAWRALFLLAFPALLTALLPPLYRTRGRIRWMLLCLAGIAGFSGQFYFSSGDHYFQYLFAFAAIGTSLTGAWMREQGRTELAVWGCLALLGVGWLLSRPAGCTNYGIRKQRQQVLAETVRSHVSPDSALLVFNATHFGLYYLTGRKPPVLNGRYCYSYGPLVLTETLMLQKMQASPYILKVRKTSGWELKETPDIQYFCSQCDTIWQDRSAVLLYHQTPLEP